ncbi:hypothetical protein M426DRAFT_28422 [Hypoxylon sp. CI-4A]|nr:hypothetical protein M426DRAFT_28422 [Hypoxylon sp. CI-4A]
MYGIIAFNKGDNETSAEFRPGSGRYGRGSACKQCRISRVRCSGTRDGESCRRCKRLAKRCYYISKQPQRNNASNQFPETNDTSVALPGAISPEPANPNSPMPHATSASPSNLTSCDAAQPFTSNLPELDFEEWFNNTSLEPEFPQPNIDLGVLDAPCFPSLHLEDVRGNDDLCDNLAPLSSELKDDGAGEENVLRHEPDASKPYLDHQDRTSDGRGMCCQCNCLKALTSSLSFLRSWTRDGQAAVESGIMVGGMALNCVEAEDFLTLFDKSMAQLRTAESCPMACILSQDLAILLLVVLEQLAKLLLSLATDPTRGSREFPLDVPPQLSPHSLRIQDTESNSTQPGRGIRLARIGTFETMDSFDLQMIMKLLLQIRTQSLDAYIGRLSNKIKGYGLETLEADLKKITEDLSKAVF